MTKEFQFAISILFNKVGFSFFRSNTPICNSVFILLSNYISADKEERLRAKEPRTIFSKGEIPAPDARNIKVISAEGSNLSSLVDAADIVRAKVKYPNENNNLVSSEYKQRNIVLSLTVIFINHIKSATCSNSSNRLVLSLSLV